MCPAVRMVWKYNATSPLLVKYVVEYPANWLWYCHGVHSSLLSTVHPYSSILSNQY